MRKFIFSILVLLLTTGAAFAQDAEAAYKQARKAFTAYGVNSDLESLRDAVTNADVALNSGAYDKDAKALLQIGDIYAAVPQKYMMDNTINPEGAEYFKKNAAQVAASAYMKAYMVAEKKGNKRKAMSSLENVLGSVTNESIYGIQAQDWQRSLDGSRKAIEVYDFIKANDGNLTAYQDTAYLNDHYYGGLSAIYLEDYVTAKPLLVNLKDMEYEESGLYDGLFKVYMAEEDLEAAQAILTEGREKFPNETNLLFAEINFYLKQGKLDQLISKLEQAIQKEPDNMSLYATKANVLDQLSKKALEAEDEAKAAEYRAAAEAEYERGLERDPESAPLIYGLGIMIFNRAAEMSQELQELGNDFSKAGQAKYDELKPKVDAEFAKALPYFKKSETKDPNSANTLTALKEMYARMQEYDLSNEFKRRLEIVQGGGKVEGSYFEANGM